MVYTPPSGDAADFSLSVYTPPSGDAASFELGIITAQEFLLGFGVRKKLGRPEWADPLDVFGIWQMRMTKRGKRPIRMKFYTPTNPQTELQEANRAKFAAAMSAWGSLTPTEKGAYNERAKKRGLYGVNLFIREYFTSN